jgi:hypothetical protein
MASRGRNARDDADSLVNLNARVPRHLWRRVRLQCLREERLLRSFITDALREYLRAHPSGGSQSRARSRA